MSETRGPKAIVFDDQILPHLDAIKAACEANNINYAAYFALDEVMPKCIIQARRASIPDQTDLPGMQTVLEIWGAIQESEDHFNELFVDNTSLPEN